MHNEIKISCKEYVASEKERIKEIVKNREDVPVLDIISVGEDPASAVYVRGKMKDCEEVGIIARHTTLGEKATQAHLDYTVEYFEKEGTDGIIIQLPVPRQLNPFTSLKKKLTYGIHDVDGFVFDKHIPCTPRGIIDWLDCNGVEISGANVVIVGRSEIVGRPLAKVLLDMDATVTVCHSQTPHEDLVKHCQIADIIVVAVGKHGVVKTSECNPDAIIIDVGINRDENGKLCGDVEIEEGHTNYVTPVPGGVGLLTRISLLKNLLGE